MARRTRRTRFVPDSGAGKFTFSSRFRRVLKKHPVPNYRIGIAAGWAVPTLYKALAGMTTPSLTDVRPIRRGEPDVNPLPGGGATREGNHRKDTTVEGTAKGRRTYRAGGPDAGEPRIHLRGQTDRDSLKGE